MTYSSLHDFDDSTIFQHTRLLEHTKKYVNARIVILCPKMPEIMYKNTAAAEDATLRPPTAHAYGDDDDDDDDDVMIVS